MMNYMGMYSWGWGSSLGLGLLLFPLIVWSITWKGMALWRAARNESKEWFIALLILNTLGILDILYLYVFSNQKSSGRR